MMQSMNNAWPAALIWLVASVSATEASSEELIKDPICTPFAAQTTVFEHITISHYFSKTITKHITECFTHTITFNETETEFDTTHITETGTDTVLITETGTETETDTVRTTTTNTDTITETKTQTKIETQMDTTTSVETIFSTKYDPCPSWCSVDADTVTVMYWPTDRPHEYPDTYIDTDLDYIFKSPSVYLIIPSAKGTNTKGEWVGPTTTNWVLPLDINEVSTIADGPTGSLTRQLQLKDLGTKCAQSVDEKSIKTLSDPQCAPILAAPSQVRDWAYPCNACGRFGLHDPPYAIPTATGGLIDDTKATLKPESTPAAVTHNEEIKTEEMNTTVEEGNEDALPGQTQTTTEGGNEDVRPGTSEQGDSAIGASPTSQPEIPDQNGPDAESTTITKIPGAGDGVNAPGLDEGTTPIDLPTVVPTPSDPETAGSGKFSSDKLGFGISIAIATMFLLF